MVDPRMEFAARLKELKRQAGEPSLQDLARAADELDDQTWDGLRKEVAYGVPPAPTALSTSSMARWLNAEKQPRWDSLATFVVACAAYAEATGYRLAGEHPRNALPGLIRKWQARHEDLFDDLAAAAGRGGPLGARDRHRADVRKAFVPPEGVLGRGRELDELEAFCRGDDPYAWWVGVPWAGKTALMAKFAAQEYRDVEVVSFFVTARLESQASGAAMVPALVRQLYDIVAADGSPDQIVRLADADWSVLLCEAAALVAASGRRLLLLVDGLDEDRGAAAGSGQRSIAEMLPSRVPDGLRVLVTSRPDYRIPDTVAGSHPLRSCRPRTLVKSPFAADVESHARQELKQLLNGTYAERTVLGLIAASGGGLAPADLAALAELPWPVLREMFEGVFGRTVVRRDIDGAEVVLFAHEALRVQAEGDVGADLPGYRQRVIDWARRFAGRRWPAETPRYLLRDYPSMLRAASQGSELVRLATDVDRHQRLCQDTGGDGAALQEIKDAQDVTSGAPELTLAELTVLADLAAYRDELLRRNQHIPPRLPGLWVRLGDPVRAGMLAKSIRDPQRRAATQAAMDRAGSPAGPAPETSSSPRLRIEALAKAIEAAGGKEELIAEIERESEKIDDPYDRANVLSAAIKSVAAAGSGNRATPLIDLAQAVAAAAEPVAKRNEALRVLAQAVILTGDDATAEALARTITDAQVQEQALVGLARLLADRGRFRRAEALAMAITNPERRGRVVAHHAAKADQPGFARAFRLARRLDHRYWRASALLTLAGAALDRDEHDRARECVRLARAAAPEIPDDPSRDKVMTRLAATLGRMGDFPAARRLVRLITADKDRADALTMVAKIAAGAGRIETATVFARAVNNPYHQANAIRQVAEILAQQDVEAARNLVNSVREPDRRARCLTALARELASIGEHGAAEAVAGDVATPAGRVAAYAMLIRAVDPTDQQRVVALVELATADAASIDRPAPRAEALTAVAESAAAVGAVPLARHLAERAGQIARQTEDTSHRVGELRVLALARAATGHPAAADLAGQAERCAAEIRDPDERLAALADVAHTRNAIGDEAGALDLVRTLVAGHRPGRLVTTLVATLAEAGCDDLAREFALSIADPRWQAQSLAEIAVSAAREGRRKRAKTVTEKAEALLDDVDPLAKVRILARLAEAMTFSDRPKPAAALLRRAEKVVAGISDADQRTRAWKLLTPGTAGSPEAHGTGQPPPEDAVRPLIDRIRAAGPDGTTVEVLIAEAAALARRMELPYQRAKTFGTLAHAAATFPGVDDLITEGVEHAHAIADPRRHSDALRTLALAAAAAGHRQWCHQLGERAGALIPPAIGNRWPVAVQRTVVRVTLSASDLDLAYAIASAIDDPELKPRTLRELAEAEAGRGRADRARTIAGTISDPGCQHPAAPDAPEPGTDPVGQAQTVRTLIGEGRLDEAEELAGTLPDVDIRVQAFTSLVTANAAADRRGRALGLAEQAAEWADTVEPRYRNARLLAALAEAVAAIDEADRARMLADRAMCHAEKVETANRRAEVLTALLRAMALIADHRRCLELARRIGPRRNRALSEAVKITAERDLDTALTLASYIPDPATRCGALVAAARAQSDPIVIRTLLASVLRHGSWTQVLADPDDLPRDVVDAVADFVTLRQSRERG